MSFMCGFCHRPQPAGTKPICRVTEERRIILQPLQTKDPKTGLVTVSSRERREPVKVIQACPDCAKIPITPEVIEVIERR